MRYRKGEKAELIGETILIVATIVFLIMYGSGYFRK